MTAIAVVVATCNRSHELGACLRSLLAQTVPADEIVVVDDAPGGALTPAVVASCAQQGVVRYVAGPGAGLAAAHNLGLARVSAALVAFTDDDVVADPRWLEHIHDAFASLPDVGCVTGRIRAYELETRAQRLLDSYAGFDKGERRRVFDLHEHRPEDSLFPFTAGAFGSGANMAFRRSSLTAQGGFDAALGAGTRARGGDDLAAFFEVLQRGEQLVYEPGAVVYHRHAREMAALERQVFGYGVGLSAYLTGSFARRPQLLTVAARRAPAALAHIVRRDSAKNARLAADYPARLRRRERLGMLVGPFAYAASRHAARRSG